MSPEYWFVKIELILFVFIAIITIGFGSQVLSGPKNVLVESVNEESVTISWTPPEVSKSSDIKVMAYVLVCAPVGIHSHEEKEVLLPPTITTGRIDRLEKGRHYSIVVSAVYTGYKRVAAPKLVIATREGPKMEKAVSDDVYPETEPDTPECNCSAPGMLACTRTSQTSQCNCFKGYEGEFCEHCSQGYVRVDKECQLCPCTDAISTGVCIIGDKQELQCESCLPGHRGVDCRTCSAGYHWKNERCQPLNCLSFTLCAEEKDAPGCKDCVFLEDNNLPANAQKSNDERTIADGTVPLVAVIVTLGVIVLVASGATCYRFWSRRHSNPRLPFWSIELTEEKLNLGTTDCQYQHLDAAAASSRATTNLIDGTPAKQATVNV